MTQSKSNKCLQLSLIYSKIIGVSDVLILERLYMIKYRCETCKISTETSECPVCKDRTHLESSSIFWCKECNIPLFDEVCPICGQHAEYLATDLRPVFPEERLLIELVLGKPNAFIDKSVWNGTGNIYYVDGKRIKFSISKLKEVDIEDIRNKLNMYSQINSYDNFNQTIKKFVAANKIRYDNMVEDALRYIREKSADFNLQDMFVSFSGGKDSTVVSDLVRRGLSTAKVLHIFGNTTLEFPETLNYIDRFKKGHPSTLVRTAENKEKDFLELCSIVGPPSRVMRWCCTVFKTGAITRRVSTLFRDKNKILSFHGLRRNESTSRNKYERDSKDSKIAKQIVAAPIIDWLDFDIWLYLMTTGIDFNYAYRFGYSRVGCWCCPNNSGWSEFLSKIYMPEEFNKFRETLINFAKQIGKPDPEEYVDGGYWKARQGGNGVEFAKRTIISFEPCATEENTFNYELQRPITADLYELFKPFGYINKELGKTRLGEVYVLSISGETILRLQGRIGTNLLKVTIYKKNIAGSKSLRAAEEKIKCQLTKYQMCMSCKACISVCKHDAITIRDRSDGTVEYKINDEKCVRCADCVAHFNAGCYMRKVLKTKE